MPRSHVTHPFSVSRGNIFVCLICVCILSSSFRSRTITFDKVIGCLRHRTLRCVSSSIHNIVLALNVLLVVAVGAPFYCAVYRPCPLILGNLIASLLVPRVSSLSIHPGAPLIRHHCLDLFIWMTVSSLSRQNTRSFPCPSASAKTSLTLSYSLWGSAARHSERRRMGLSCSSWHTSFFRAMGHRDGTIHTYRRPITG